jgi:uncharacterized SAM-binding protein YcdF (DUF218 family)
MGRDRNSRKGFEMKPWSRPKDSSGDSADSEALFKWMGGRISGLEGKGGQRPDKVREETSMEKAPIEPKGIKLTRPSIFRWIIFLIIIAYMLVSYFRAPLLQRIGGYLVLEHPVKKADLVVCISDRPVEEGLAAAEIYKRGLSARVFVPREDIPDGKVTLDERGVHYPESRDLFTEMLKGLGVPKSAIISSDRFAGNLFDEAMEVKKLCVKNRYSSIIVVTPPTLSRVAWQVFERVFEKEKIKVMVMPSRYTKFKVDDWWKTKKYVREVVRGYQRLIYSLTLSGPG